MVDGNTFTWHATGRALLEAMLRAIAGAKEEVCLEMFIYKDSLIGRRFRAELAAAARRGVRVRVLVDGIGSFGLGRDYFAEVTEAGGEAQRFNEIKLLSFSFRDHRKLLVVDRRDACLGGCNIAEEYDGDGISSGWRDCGVGVSGEVCEELAAEFDRQWQRADGQQWTFFPTALRRGAGAPFHKRVEAMFSKPGLSRNPLREALQKDLLTAREVMITSAYFLPSLRMRRRLAQAAKRGARVRLLLAGKSDVGLMQLASRSLYRGLLRRGVGIWEYQPQVLHAKVIIVDDHVYVGSSNLDPRSLRINFEVMLRIRDKELAATVRRQFEEDLSQRSLPINADSLRRNGSWWLRLRQRLAYWLLARFDTELAAVKLQIWRGRKARLVQRVKRLRNFRGQEV